MRSERPSRLKGIETYLQTLDPKQQFCSERPSRLKGIETEIQVGYRIYPSVQKDLPV